MPGLDSVHGVHAGRSFESSHAASPEKTGPSNASALGDSATISRRSADTTTPPGFDGPGLKPPQGKPLTPSPDQVATSQQQLNSGIK